MNFSREYIDHLLSTANLFDVMKANGVEIRSGSGKNAFYVADWCCGKTDDDNGRVDKRKNTYKCMACGTGGNAIHFMRDLCDMSFKDAVLYLSKFSNVPVPEANPEESEFEKRKTAALTLAMEFYQTQDHDYFLSRGITKEVLKTYKAGYAPGGRKLRSHLEEKGFTKQELIDFDLINSKGMDFMFYRAVIPYYLNGKVNALYGRAVNDEKSKRSHVYINGEFILGGIDQIDPKRIVNLFESGIDRLAAESHGINNGVDPGGAMKFNSTHARLLKRKGVHHVSIMFDGDKAGREGSYNAGIILENEGIKVWIVELPEGRDPAQLLQIGGIDSLLPFTKKYKEFPNYRAFYELDQYPIELLKKYMNEKEGTM